MSSSINSLYKLPVVAVSEGIGGTDFVRVLFPVGESEYDSYPIVVKKGTVSLGDILPLVPYFTAGNSSLPAGIELKDGDPRKPYYGVGYFTSASSSLSR